MADDTAFADLLETLYGGLTRAPPWEGFLRALATATNTTFATLLIGRGHAGIDAHVTPGADPERTQEYQKISQADPFVGLPEGQVVSFRDFVSHIPARFRDWLGVAHSEEILGVDLHRPPDVAVRLRLTRDNADPPFGDAERTLLTRLIPHLRIALDLHARLTTTQAESQLFSSAMAGLAVATLILDREGRILRRNAVAMRMLEEGEVITERNDRLEPRTGSAATTISRILASPPPLGEEILFDVATATGPALHARARAVPSSAYGDGAWLALFIADPSHPAGPSEEALRERFQLTRAEAGLALHLAQGATLADAADAIGIAYNTARSHLRAIFAKTDTHRQVQLVTLLRTVGGEYEI
ncbi:putative LuxR family transcriptional regulator [Sphingobium herbicidovorans NBRC 16415]|uniref:LuxR family transcriptional regulator n=1 Tax=Sphingobium herbicidovorans (strain ATCC 700291 / DSM 11019 / CCUG 56400 / KCTC 2939 / LMG 18315 / NBRC 16415 / MH) TaxID=1219045 RepID=A0A086P4J9_SPHHM|nr:helix-turn-helix transcriptional regulator [Sphingobium herbicidovorans]KFG88317.1 putative LuxR family transcriptional regulator [Sphingobium herbicidovorans NBRC 16415]